MGDSLEAMDGGTIALVEENDIIEIDIDRGILNLHVSNQVLSERRANWKQPEPKVKDGYLPRYARLVGPVSEGANL